MTNDPSHRVSLGVISDGWEEFCRLCMPETLPEGCKRAHRISFYAGAVHVYSAIVGENVVNPDGSLQIDPSVAECTRIEALEWCWERAIAEGQTETDAGRRIKALLDKARGVPN